MVVRGLSAIGVVVVLMALVLLAPACAAQARQPSPRAVGQQLYQANCSGCHGEGAIGGIRVGGVRSGNLRARTLEGTYFNDTRLIERAILDGLDEEGNPLDADMPRWSGKFSDVQVAALIAYLRSLR